MLKKLAILSMFLPAAAVAQNADTAASSDAAAVVRRESLSQKSAQEATRSVSIAEAQEMARKHNPNAEITKESLEQADILIWRAYAVILPQITLNGSLTMNNKSVAMQGMTIQEKWITAFQATATLPLFNGQAIPLIKNAYENVDAADLQQKYTENEIDFAVLAAAYSLVAAKEAVNISQASLERAEESLKEAERRVQVGTGIELEVLRAKLQVSQAQQSLDNAMDGVHNARASLGYLTGESNLDIGNLPNRDEITHDLKKLQEEAKKERLDLKALRKQLNMTERQETQTLFSWLPVLMLQGQYTWTSNTSIMTGNEHDSWKILLAASWSLFDGGDRIALQKSQESTTRQVKANYRAKEIEIEQSIEKALVDLEAAERSMLIAQEQADLAKESHRLVMKQYEAGLARSLDVSDATATSRQADLAVVVQALQYKLAALSLERLVGRTMRM